MKKFLKLSALTLSILMLTSMTVVGASAQTPAAPVRYDAASEGIVSSYYSIDREKGFITGITPGTSAEKLLRVCLPGNAVVSQETLATGATITATCSVAVPPEAPSAEPSAPATDPTEPSVEPSAPATDPTEPSVEPSAPATDPTEPSAEPSEPVVDPTEPSAPSDSQVEPVAEQNPVPAAETKTYSLTVIVTGDLNGDAGSTITDMLMLKSFILGENLSETAIAAGDMNGDGNVTITDFLQIKSNLLGLETASAGNSAEGSGSDPIILMTPSSAEIWNSGLAAAGVASFASDDDTVAVIDETGTITSLSGEGSTFVYALDANGKVLLRAMVTVLDEKLAISFNASSHRLTLGQTLTLYPSFNHPVSPAVTWSSSDQAIVTTDQNGTITTQNFGTAVVTASLANGSKAEAAITVVPPITAIEFEKSLYKIKPGSTRSLGVLLAPADTGEEIVWASSDTSIARVSNDGTVTGVAYGTVTITATGKFSGLSASCRVKVCNAKQVAITFDDGPSGYTRGLLDFLKENDIRATFFLVGNRISNLSDIVKRQADEGHEIGYHSYAHVIQTTLSSEQIISEFQYSDKILKDITGKGFTAWRSPGGGYNDRVLNCIPLPHINWSVDTQDWVTLNTDSVYSAIINNAKDGSIILLHDLYKSSVNGAIKAMQEMNAGDYEFMTVTELLSRNGTPPEKSTNYFSG